MYRTYIVKDGDSLHLISQRELGDTNRWVEIADLNELQYPFITDINISVDNTVKPGDIIKLPEEVQIDTPVMEEELNDSDLLLQYDKFSLSFSNNGELVEDGYGDLKTINGLSCLMQDLVNRLVTPRGTLPYHPEYGSDINSIVGNKMDKDWIDKAKLEVMSTFAYDDRVVEVKDVLVSAKESTISISCNIITLDGLTSINLQI